MDSSQRVAVARRALDSGDVSTATTVIVEMAVEDRAASMPYETRMRWYELLGALERAGHRPALVAIMKIALKDWT